MVLIQNQETGNLNVHGVKNQSINEQENAIFERCVNSILYFLKK